MPILVLVLFFSSKVSPKIIIRFVVVGYKVIYIYIYIYTLEKIFQFRRSKSVNDGKYIIKFYFVAAKLKSEKKIK